MDKNYRIHTNIVSDTLLEVNMQQDFDFLEVLSMKLSQRDAYRLHSSNYGVIVGRVLANDAFGIPNAKISIFIERDVNDSSDIESIYPYSEVTSKDKEGRRYNLLPDYNEDDCYRVVGTFPNKRLMLDDDIQVEIYDKYWKYTTVTNNAGDYMLFGVPTGSTTVHVDIDLSDIGILSQKPRDFEYKGYTLSMFDSPTQFKESTNLDNLAQIFSQNRSVFVYPFWGDSDNGIAAITRADIQIQYKFEPTCVFMGSIISDNEGHDIGHNCSPNIDNGMNDQLVGGNGTIEMIRKTPDGLIEEYQIQGNQLIDENGVWCYQIPMNLDYIGTDEYGNIVPTDDVSKGIPTRTQVRFRISKTETGTEGTSVHTAKYLVPMNPLFSESGTTISGIGRKSNNGIVPVIDKPGSEIEKMYNFGSSTPGSCFRDLYWNNVYSVKNYIPKVQVAHRPFSKNYGALKGANLVEDQNPIPFNKLRIDVPFTYILICILIYILVVIVEIINAVLCVVYFIINTINEILEVVRVIPIVGTVIPPLDWLLEKLSCIALSGGLTEGNVAFYPGCWCGGYGKCPSEMTDDCEKSENGAEYMDRVQRSLAQEYKIVKLDFYQDWINGALYMPLWYWRKRRKKTFFFGLFSSSAKNDFCSCDEHNYTRLKTYTTCEMPYSNVSLDIDNRHASEGEVKWHKNRAEEVRYTSGLIRPFVNKDDLTIYYYSALQPTSDNANHKQPLGEREANFYAVRLYATDIILLGNLLEDNLYGIPQLFKVLPPTTANLPAIATIEESNQEETKQNFVYESADSEESGTTIITGMDWGRASVSQSDTPIYKRGLFMDIGCTFADTRIKSCINVERLSELGVSLDVTYRMSYASDKSKKAISTGYITTDGFITKLELDDFENRAMFATMNHIGFVPQTYATYDTQINDENTNYLIPKFKYLYPVDFDGRQQTSMSRYKNGFQQPMYDEKDDEAYLTFRLGAEKNLEYEKNSEHRVRHFYKVPDTIDSVVTASTNSFYMPLYNNSFYFYFGIKKGNTAIDKFSKMFYSECVRNDKKPFVVDIDQKPRSYCPMSYSPITDGYGYIRVRLEDIKPPFTYSLYDAKNNLVISEDGMDVRDFVIGGYLNSGTVQTYEDGLIHYQKDNSKIVDTTPYDTQGLTNQLYYLTITDTNGKFVTERVTLEMAQIEANIVTTDLSSKFYSSAATRIDYICHEDNDYYGRIDITGFTVDGYDCIIDDVGDDVNYSEESGYTMCISGHSDVSSSLVAWFSIKSIEGGEGHIDKSTKNCMCDKENDIAIAQGASDNMFIDEAKKRRFMLGVTPIDSGDDSKGKKVSFFVYQPASFVATIIQGCPNCQQLVLENSSSNIVVINNAENFRTYLNDMPVNFMLGSINDSVDASVSQNSKFYALDGKNIPTDEHLSGWYGVHQESSYMFSIEPNEVSERNKNLWKDYVNFNDDIHMPSVKRNILTMKFNSMFSLSDAVYVGGRGRFMFTSQGGVQPLLRNIAPNYKKGETKLLTPNEGYLFNDGNSVVYSSDYPNVVGANYKGQDSGSYYPQWNNSYRNSGHTGLIGNYFAGFTHNGSYLPGNKKKIDGNINIGRQPNFASISPYSSNKIKELGKDEEFDYITTVPYVYQQDKQQLSGDKKRTVNPWLRALNVDRRYDYDLTILGPVVGDAFKLHSSDAAERPWQSIRISGFTYNGIEMSYDDTYNVISADTVKEDDDTGMIISQSANTRLEYSYYYSDGDKYTYQDSMGRDVPLGLSSGTQYMESVTVYNHSDNMVWSETHKIHYKDKDFGFNASFDTPDKQIIKESYVNEIGGFDVRNFYWSNFNKERLNLYCDSPADNCQIGGKGVNGFLNDENPFYVFQYPHDVGSLYNGDFNRDSVTSGNYPSKRFIDIGNIAPTNSINFTNESCSYNIRAKQDSVGNITGTTSKGEGVRFDWDFENPVVFNYPSQLNKEYANIVYEKTSEDDFVKFEANTVSLYFGYNLKSMDSFDVYTRTPRLIQVLPYINGTDGITYIKSANPGSEFSGSYADGLSLDAAVENATFYTFSQKRLTPYFSNNDISVPSGVDVKDKNMTTKNGKAVEGYYFFKDGKPLASNDENFARIIFMKNNIDLKSKNISVFTILVERECWYKENDGLTRRLRVLEFPELIDGRHLLLKPVFGDASSPFSFVEYKKINTKVTGGDTPSDEPSPIGVDGGIYSQVLAFEMKFEKKDDPLEMQNYAFADVNNMGYIFEFIDSQGVKYYIEDGIEVSVVTSSDALIVIRFAVRWTQDMGILQSGKWSNAQVAMYGKTSSGFTYKLPFQISLVSQDSLPETEGVKSITNFVIR